MVAVLLRDCFRTVSPEQSRYSTGMGLSTVFTSPASRADSSSSRVIDRRWHGAGTGYAPRGCSLLAVLFVALGAAYAGAQPPEPAAYLDDLDEDPALIRTGEPIEERVREFLVPLGAIQKVRGVWRPDESERVSGQRLAYTWRVEEGFRAEEFVDMLDARLAEDPAAKVIFSCDARACGSSVQWANRIFRERVLYGRQESQRYRAYKLERDGREYRLLVYGSARTTDRQYVRAELLTREADDQ